MWRFSAATLGMLAIVAVVLASLGVYAVLSHAVVERRREIGVRVAVGALPRQIAGLVVREGALLIGVGALIGVAASLAAGRAVSDLLHDVPPVDPLTIAAVTLLFALVSLAAMLVPVRRAVRVNAVDVLRQ